MDSLRQRLRLLLARRRAETGWTVREREAWAELALRLAFDKVEAQRNEVVRIRSQALLFVTFLGASLAFLIGAVINPQVQRTSLFYTLTIIGTVLLAVLALILVAVVVPILRFHFSLNAKTLLGWRRGANPVANYLEAVESLVTTTLPNDIGQNRKMLVLLRWMYAGLLVVGMSCLSVWIWVLWACT